jgi:FKBP-type peptidyl-prolyl cis-trans isomerase FklB
MRVKNVIFAFVAGMLALSACNLQKNNKGSASLKTENDSVSYSLGVYFGQTIKSQGLDTVNTDVLAQAIEDIMSSPTATPGDTANKNTKAMMNPEQAGMYLSSYFQNLQRRKSETNLKEGQNFLAQNKNKEGIKTTASGLQYRILKEGNGPSPAASDTVVAHYTGKTINGKVFDTSLDNNQPLVYPANQLIPGWTEALQLMKVGSKWELFIPAELAYGERGAGQDIGPNSTLIFEMELLGIGTPDSLKRGR